MASVTWGVDGHGKTWPWCEDCGKQFGQVSPCEVVHQCPSRPLSLRPPAPDRITMETSETKVNHTGRTEKGCDDE